MKGCAPWRVALVVIARDEASRIGRLLASVRDHVDEMLVLDTGSVDETVAVAVGQGARVEHFPWVDDFAAARNAALAAADADWHVVLDADEWLIDGAEALARLRSEEPAFVGSVLLEDHFDDGQPRTAHGRISRVLPGEVRYRGGIHEQPAHNLSIRSLPVRIGHDGYTPAALARKRGRNRPMLRQAVDGSPHDGYLWYQLGKDASAYDEHDEAEMGFSRAAGLRQPIAPWWPDMVARRLFTLKRLGRHEEALRWIERELAACADSPDVHFALGDLLLDWAAEVPSLGPTLLPMVEAAWTRCLEIGERPDQIGAVAGRGSYLASYNLTVIRDGLRGVSPAGVSDRGIG